jgi:N,N-dimethylformamidase
MLPLAGYTDRLSVRPGERIGIHVSHRTGARVTASVVRVHSADANPASPGVRTSPVMVIGEADVAHHPVALGSYARADLGSPLAEAGSFSIVATVWPTRVGGREQPIVSWLDPAAGTGAQLTIDTRGRVAAAVGCGPGQIVRHAGGLLTERTWVEVWCTYDAATRALAVGSRTLPAGVAGVSATTTAAPMVAPANGRIAIAASPAGTFNGKIERPMVFGRALAGPEVRRVLSGEDAPGILAAWDFAADMGTSRIVDRGPHGCHGKLLQRPTRAVTGSTWIGREHCWRHAPDQYAAIHFHDDDIDDCGWPAAFQWTVPADLPSGCYAVMLTAADGTSDNLPFFVVPPKGQRSADVAVLVSTYTYTVYGNMARVEWGRDPAWRDAWQSQSDAWGAYPYNPAAHPDYGLSTYNFHTDGSGIAYASWRRPMLNLRIGYVTYPYPEIRGSGLRHYPADMHLIHWLERERIAYDVVTDAELHHDGVDLLRPYTVLMTGTHPEYHTPDMLDALEAYRDGGGRLIYLGGNGFYWKIALDPEREGVVEIRRAEGGIRAWAAEVGEYYNAFDGAYGGLWRRNARPPQKLVGVGFTAQGNFVGSHYRIAAEAHASRAVWILDGVAGPTFGGVGLSGHGAAGFELDRADKRLGTPAHAIILAASEGHKPDAPWVLVPEEHLTHIVTWAGEPAEKLVRADMVFFETPRGGAVFSTGSITFCGSLLVDPDTSRILSNVLGRFRDPSAAFLVPVSG